MLHLILEPFINGSKSQCRLQAAKQPRYIKKPWRTVAWMDIWRCLGSPPQPGWLMWKPLRRSLIKWKVAEWISRLGEWISTWWIYFCGFWMIIFWTWTVSKSQIVWYNILYMYRYVPIIICALYTYIYLYFIYIYIMCNTWFERRMRKKQQTFRLEFVIWYRESPANDS